jgi:hypothetical protein
MYTCDPVLLFLIVMVLVICALIVRELALRGGYLDGQKLFDGSCGGCTGAGEFDISPGLDQF